jgi:D-sedoheptulose 7-phosphate isomerase
MIKFLDSIKKEIIDSISTKDLILGNNELIKQIQLLIDSCLFSLSNGGKIILAGNGGSFADAQHLSAEFTSRFMFDRNPLPSIALGTNSSAMSAIGNDYGYEEVFSRELDSIATSNDLFIPISTSGNSKNIINAIEVAMNKNIRVIALSGSSGGLIKPLCECICIPSNNTARIQEAHIMIGHIICGIVEAEFFK